MHAARRFHHPAERARPASHRLKSLRERIPPKEKPLNEKVLTCDATGNKRARLAGYPPLPSCLPVYSRGRDHGTVDMIALVD